MSLYRLPLNAVKEIHRVAVRADPNPIRLSVDDRATPEFRNAGDEAVIRKECGMNPLPGHGRNPEVRSVLSVSATYLGYPDRRFDSAFGGTAIREKLRLWWGKHKVTSEILAGIWAGSKDAADLLSREPRPDGLDDTDDHAIPEIESHPRGEWSAHADASDSPRVWFGAEDSVHTAGDGRDGRGADDAGRPHTVSNVQGEHTPREA
jgi:hypothetical protein